MADALDRLDRVVERAIEVVSEEAATGALEWWLLDFAEESPPQGRGFLGGLLIKAQGMGSAVVLATARGLNPGGEVVGFTVPYSDAEAEPYADRLLSRDEAVNLPVPAALSG